MANSTMGDIVTGALKRLRIINARETAEAVVSSDALTALNDMMHSWKANGVDTDHETLESTDDFPLDEEFKQGVIALLSVRLAQQHGIQIDEGIARDAAQGWEGLQMEFFEQAATTEFDLGLRRTGRLFY